MTALSFDLQQGNRASRLEVVIERLVIAGWTGRDAQAVQHHIDELAAIGVPPPSSVPVYYRVAESLLTQRTRFQVLGEGSSGEAEPVLFATEAGLWLTLGSDHTDREAERAGVALSKQLCPKPVARQAWRWNEIAERADALLLSSWIRENNRELAYQQGTLSLIRPLTELIQNCPGGLTPGTMMFCGTLSAIGGVRACADFRCELHDPVGERSISLDYHTESLPIVS
ncbi:MAG: DUF2848 domain-containing protein [Quisquiliibacterium sp.]